MELGINGLEHFLLLFRISISLFLPPSDFPVSTPEGHLSQYDSSFSLSLRFSHPPPSPPSVHSHLLCSPLFFFYFSVDKLTKCPMCDKPFDDPRTLPCLHSFCLGCLEAQQFTAKSKSSDLLCHQCSAPFTLPGSAELHSSPATPSSTPWSNQPRSTRETSTGWSSAMDAEKRMPRCTVWTATTTWALFVLLHTVG